MECRLYMDIKSIRFKKMQNLRYVLCLGVMCLAMLISCKDTYTEIPTGLEVLGFEREAVQGIHIEYLGVSVKLDQEDQNQIMSCFESATFVEKMKVEPFNESEFVLSIESETQVLTYPICWFNAKQFDEEENVVGDLDRRFDILIQDEWYVFQQSQDTYWNEDKMINAFYKAIRQEDVQLPDRYIIEGFDAENNPESKNGFWTINHLIPRVNDSSAYDIIDEAEIVIIGVFEGYGLDYRPNFHNEIYEGVRKIQVTEVLKGDDIKDSIYIESQFGLTVVNGRKHIFYPPREIPEMRIGESYLMCLREEECLRKYTEPDLYRVTDDMIARAVIVDNTTYPCYNTEYHPFYKVNVDDIRDYIKAQK